MAKRRRVRSPHPGVKLKRRVFASGAASWRATYVDPDTGRQVYITLDHSLSTQEARTQWARKLAASLARRRADRAAGVVPVKTWSLEDAINIYLETARATLKPKTLQGHDLAIGKLREWATDAGVATTGDLTPARLAQFRDVLIRALRRGSAPGGSRGATVETEARRSPVTVNRELRSTKTLLNSWRRRGMLPSLHRDDISDALAALPVLREDPGFLPPAALKQLLAAAQRHDAECFALTRAEHARGLTKGNTRRHPPIAGFVAFVLLTGMRRGEALATPWAAVDLDALDHEGRKVGEIRLAAAITKTNRARTVGLEVSPALRKLLASQRLSSGGKGRVFGGAEPYTSDMVEKARRRMVAHCGAPPFTWQLLRSTCATYLTNAPGIFGAATVFLSAKQLGHSVAVAERHYLGVHRGIPRDARTLEAAMQIEAELSDVGRAKVSRVAAMRT